MLMHQRKMGVFIALALSGGVHAQTCAPGQATDCNPEASSAVVIVPAPTTALVATCTVPGTWLDSFGGVAKVASNLSGTKKYGYCSSAHNVAITLQGNIGFRVAATWPGGSDCQSFTEDLTFVTCLQAAGTYVNADGSSGNNTWVREARIIGITADGPIIPTAATIQNRKALTRSNLTVTATEGGQPVSGATVSLQSDRGAVDTITGPANPTDAAGRTSARVETRNQPGPSSITSSDADTVTDPAAQITWLPARYESQFLITCYVLSQESEFPAKPVARNIPGLPAGNEYRRRFLKDVRLQGSGLALDGTYIHYDGHGRFSIQNCALTASGACAVDGSTAAVDRALVPFRSTIEIDGDGQWNAHDTGGAIDGYHIDEFWGIRRAECLANGQRNLVVELNHY